MTWHSEADGEARSCPIAVIISVYCFLFSTLSLDLGTSSPHLLVIMSYYPPSDGQGYQQQGGYQQQQGGYPQQQGGYPQQQGGYPQQPGFDNQSGYQQQYGAPGGYQGSPEGYGQAQSGGFPQQHGGYGQQDLTGQAPSGYPVDGQSVPAEQLPPGYNPTTGRAYDINELPPGAEPAPQGMEGIASAVLSIFAS